MAYILASGNIFFLGETKKLKHFVLRTVYRNTNVKNFLAEVL